MNATNQKHGTNEVSTNKLTSDEHMTKLRNRLHAKQYVTNCCLTRGKTNEYQPLDWVIISTIAGLVKVCPYAFKFLE